jgi:hypothetical protein
LEPIGAIRQEWGFASIVAALVNLRRNTEKYPKPFPISDFLVRWGEEEVKAEPPKPQGKTWQQLKLIGQVLAASYNMMEEEKQKRRRKRE